MDEPAIKRHKCTGKVPYKSGKLAVKALERWTQKVNINRFEFSIYPCEFCDSWHLGRSKFSPEKPIQNDEPLVIPTANGLGVTRLNDGNDKHD